MNYKARQCKTCKYRDEEWTFKVCFECEYGGTNYKYDDRFEPCETEGEGDNIKYL